MTCFDRGDAFLFRSAIFTTVTGTAVSASIRLIAEPVISTRWIGASWANAGCASISAALPANITRSERDKTVSIIIDQLLGGVSCTLLSKLTL
jgi:hypothetical protein